MTKCLVTKCLVTKCLDTVKFRHLASSKQKVGQSVPDYVNEVVAAAKDLNLDDANLVCIIESGLRPEFLPFFRHAKPTTPQQIINCEALQVAVPVASSAQVDQSLIAAID